MMDEPDRDRVDMDTLVELMRRLRDPETGCPWDLQQDFSTIAPYTIEEAYEVAHAISRGDLDALRGELGDLLFQVVFHSRMAEEQDRFALDDVIADVVDKLTRRHPHVFGDDTVEDAEAQTRDWEAHKRAERGARASQMDDVPLALPALMRATKLQRRAASVGFDWPELTPVREKLDEELAELERAWTERDQAAVAEELGDVLFSAVNLARHLGVDAEDALRAANRKFEQRFRAVEVGAERQGTPLDELELDGLEALWQASKREA